MRKSPSWIVLLYVLALAVAIAAVDAPGALAQRNHVLAGTFSEHGAGPGQLAEPDGVALSESLHQVYVVDEGNNRVERFSEAGAFLGSFNASDGPEVLSAPIQIAVDNSNLSEPANDPSAGDVYVLDSGHDAVDKFNGEGHYLGRITEANGTPFEELEGVAVNGEGTLLIYERSDEVAEYSSENPNAFLVSHPAEVEIAVPGLGVAPNGDLYANAIFGVTRLNSEGRLISSPIQFDNNESARGLAVDSLSSQIFITHESSVGVRHLTGPLIERFGEGQLEEPTGVAVDEATNEVFVADRAKGTVSIYVPEPVSAPAIGEVGVAEVSATGATIQAEINPHGASTTFQVQLGTTTAYSSTLPAQPILVGSQFGLEKVTLQVQGLAPGTTYHFRVIAKSSAGEEVGLDHSWSTPAAVGNLALLDDRGWEQVSPPNKAGAAIEPIPFEGIVQASESGNAVAYLADSPTEPEPAGNSALTQVLSKRAGGQWSSHDIAVPHQNLNGTREGTGEEVRFFSNDLSTSLVEQHNDLSPLSAQATEQTVYLRHNETCTADPAGCYEPLLTPGDVTSGERFGAHTEFLDATSDASHVVIGSEVALTGVHSEFGGLYEWSAGQLELISELPSTEAAEAVSLGAFNEDVRGAISSDGSRTVWGSEGHLYMHDSTMHKTVQLDALQEGASGENFESALFQIGSENDDRIAFTDMQRLTADSTAAPGEPDLYSCEIVSGEGSPSCKLTDLTVDANAGQAANVRGSVLGSNPSGTILYFVAKGVLDTTANEHGEAAAAGAENLYLDRYNATSGTWESPQFIAKLSSEDQPDWEGFFGRGPNLDYVSSRVSPDGRLLTFMSQASLTGYDNHDAASGIADEEVFLFDSSTGKLVCPSCSSTGARPEGVLDNLASNGNRGLLVDRLHIWGGHWLAASVPGWTSFENGRTVRQPRYLADGGRLFFDSPVALVSQDGNRKEDVYEYEPAGQGTCTATSPTFVSSSGGCVNLLSNGSSGSESAFLDADADGANAFFLTTSQLAAGDQDSAFDVYDARSCSTLEPCLAAPVEVSGPCTSAEACRPGSVAGQDRTETPASVAPVGPGNVVAPALNKPKPAKKPLSTAQKLQKALKA